MSIMMTMILVMNPATFSHILCRDMLQRVDDHERWSLLNLTAIAHTITVVA